MNTADWTTGRLLSTAARLNERLYNDRLREMSLTHAGAMTLRALSASGPISQIGLAELVHVQPQTMGKVLQKLDVEGLVARSQDPSNGRLTVTRITAKGDELMRRVDQMAESSQENSAFNDEKLRSELVAFIAALRMAAD